MILPELLNSQALFKGLSTGTREELAGHIKLKEFNPRSFIIQGGDPSDALLLLFSGQLQIISTTESGREIGLNLISEGDYFGEVGLIDGGPRSASVVAITKVVIGFLPKEQALNLFHHNSTVAARIQQKLCKIIRSEVESRSATHGNKAFTRVFMVISKHPQLRNSDDAGRLVDMPSQAVIARMANVSRETVSRALSSLAKAGLISKVARRIEIPNPRLIQRLAAGEIKINEIASIPSETLTSASKTSMSSGVSELIDPENPRKNRITVIRRSARLPVD